MYSLFHQAKISRGIKLRPVIFMQMCLIMDWWLQKTGQRNKRGLFGCTLFAV